MKDKIRGSAILTGTRSDHCPITLTIETKQETRDKVRTETKMEHFPMKKPTVFFVCEEEIRTGGKSNVYSIIRTQT